jgi:hypothetical protein
MSIFLYLYKRSISYCTYNCTYNCTLKFQKCFVCPQAAFFELESITKKRSLEGVNGLRTKCFSPPQGLLSTRKLVSIAGPCLLPMPLSSRCLHNVILHAMLNAIHASRNSKNVILQDITTCSNICSCVLCSCQVDFVLKTPYETVLPPQSGITTPGFRFRLTSINPHLSSQSAPGVS